MLGVREFGDWWSIGHVELLRSNFEHDTVTVNGFSLKQCCKLQLGLELN